MTSPWIILGLGILLGGVLGYISSLAMNEAVRSYVLVGVIIVMLVLGRLASPRRARKMPGNRVMLLHFISGIVFGFGIVLLLLFISS